MKLRTTQNQIIMVKKNVKVEFDFSNYARKAEVNKAADFDTSNFDKNPDLATIIFIIF